MFVVLMSRYYGFINIFKMYKKLYPLQTNNIGVNEEKKDHGFKFYQLHEFKLSFNQIDQII